jgi:predicted CXXCH cytochrome family protein
MALTSRLLPALLLLSLMLFSLWVFAAEEEKSQLGHVVLPDATLPANASNCVEPTDIMRRYHMDFLMHQRDSTVIDGIRTKNHSLTGCIDCHNPRIAGQETVRYEDPQHFCAGCHSFTGVKIDCFECHSDRGSEAS